MPFIVGLTGGIGSGKTAVADIFAQLGAKIVDTDAIAHALTAPEGAAMPALQNEFGPGMLTHEGALDRTAMRRRVFAEPATRKQLEAILHPLIRAECEAQISRLASTDFSAYVVLVVPLLVEAGGWRNRVDRIAVVDCQEETQIRRVMARGNLSRDQVLAIMQAQAGRAARLAVADDVIANDDGLDTLRQQVEALHTGYLELARQTGTSRSA